MTALLLDKTIEGFIASVYDRSTFCQVTIFVNCQALKCYAKRLNNCAVEASKPSISPDTMRD